MELDAATTVRQGGTAQVHVRSGDASTGSAELVADAFIDVTGTIEPSGPTRTVTISSAGQTARLGFDGTAAQRVTPTISGNTPTNGAGEAG